jgi:hypothetical protein
MNNLASVAELATNVTTKTNQVSALDTMTRLESEAAPRSPRANVMALRAKKRAPAPVFAFAAICPWQHRRSRAARK